MSDVQIPSGGSGELPPRPVDPPDGGSPVVADHRRRSAVPDRRGGGPVSGVDAFEEVGEHVAVEPRREMTVGVAAEIQRRAEEPVVADEEVG